MTPVAFTLILFVSSLGRVSFKLSSLLIDIFCELSELLLFRSFSFHSSGSICSEVGCLLSHILHIALLAHSLDLCPGSRHAQQRRFSLTKACFFSSGSFASEKQFAVACACEQYLHPSVVESALKTRTFSDTASLFDFLFVFSLLPLLTSFIKGSSSVSA